MQLLILKSGSTYIRVQSSQHENQMDSLYQLVGLDKASVFPFTQLEEVRRHESSLKEKGFADVRLKKLILTEEDV